MNLEIFGSFYWTKINFVGATDCCGLSVTLPMGFQARMVLTFKLIYLCGVNLRVMSGATPAFTTNKVYIV